MLKRTNLRFIGVEQHLQHFLDQWNQYTNLACSASEINNFISHERQRMTMSLIFEKKFHFVTSILFLNKLLHLHGVAEVLPWLGIMAFLSTDTRRVHFQWGMICSSREYITGSGTIFIDTLDKCRTTDPNRVEVRDRDSMHTAPPRW